MLGNMVAALQALDTISCDYKGDDVVINAVKQLEIALLTQQIRGIQDSLPHKPCLTKQEEDILRSNPSFNKIKVVGMVRDRYGYDDNEACRIRLTEAKKMVDDYIAQNNLY
jgi:hypothetical protein